MIYKICNNSLRTLSVVLSHLLAIGFVCAYNASQGDMRSAAENLTNDVPALLTTVYGNIRSPKRTGLSNENPSPWTIPLTTTFDSHLNDSCHVPWVIPSITTYGNQRTGNYTDPLAILLTTTYSKQQNDFWTPQRDAVLSRKLGTHYDKDTTLCKPNHRVLTVMEGNITWTEDSDASRSCRKQRTWVVKVPPDHGLTFKFHGVQMTKGRQLEIEFYNTSLEQWILARSIVGNNYSRSSLILRIDLSPLFVNESIVKITVNVSSRRHRFDSLTSFFNVSYYAQLKRTIPHYVQVDEWVYYATQPKYDCVPGAVPKPFLCNMIANCENGEDEESCAYREEGCDVGWIPYRGQCLRFDFDTNCHRLRDCDVRLAIGNMFPTLAMSASKMCERKFQATLATIPDDAGIRLVTYVTQQNGYRSVALNIHRFRASNMKLGHLYRHAWQWKGHGGPVAYDRQDLQTLGAEYYCAMLDIYPKARFVPTDCVRLKELVAPDGYICAKPNPKYHESGGSTAKSTQPQRVSFARAPKDWILKISSKTFSREFPLKECSDGSQVLVFDRCLWGNQGGTGGKWSPNGFSLFRCRLGFQTIHYSLACNGMVDCVDGSDETGCERPKLNRKYGRSVECKSNQMLDVSQRCNGVPDCFDGTDEENCMSCGIGRFLCKSFGCIHRNLGVRIESCSLKKDNPIPSVPYPGVARLNSLGVVGIDQVDLNDTKSLFECRPGFYLPVYMLGNGERDCPDGSDEDISVQNIVCPGYYRCRGSGNCLHPKFLCDGIYHCANKDDELYCSLACPPNCTCEGYAYSCRDIFDPYPYNDARYVDLSGVNDLSFAEFNFMETLLFLNLSRCGLSNVTLSGMPGLRILDLSFNHLFGLSVRDMSGVTHLDLTGNPFVTVLDSAFTELVTDAGLVNLETLVLRRTRLLEVVGSPFKPLSKLAMLDLRGRPLVVHDAGVFGGLGQLAELLTDESKLCCSYFYPAASIPRCHAPVDELSTCSDLLGADVFRVILWVMAIFSVLGNSAVMMVRLIARDKGSPTFRVLVVNLCASDLLMGVYIVIIGSADVIFRGVYVSVEMGWRHSALCTVAGFVAFLSSEVSTFVISLITLDRILVIGFPLNKQLHLGAKQMAGVCAAVWATAFVMAATPVLSGLEFYEVNAVCLPLPITRKRFSGQGYAFAVFVMLNFVLMLFIGAGQLFIYHSVRQAGTASGIQRREQETRIARRLFIVVFTDFCCWFPVGIMGLLASNMVPVPGEASVWTAVLLLPINSALNPFLYTLNTVLERRRKRRLAEKTRRIVNSLHTSIPKWPQALVEDTARLCIRTKLITMEKVQLWMETKEG